MKTLFLLLTLFLMGCQGANDSPIFQSSQADDLVKELKAYDYVLLGEYHNNPRHHLFRAKILKLLGKNISVGFEQLHREQQPIVDEFFNKENQDIDELEKKLQWNWFSWDIYRPLFQATYERKLQPIALNFHRSKAKEIIKKQRTYFHFNFLKETGLEKDFSKELEAKLYKAIDEGHCGQLPKEMIPLMAFAQRANDATMAWHLIRNTRKGVVIAGNGHVRKDYGMAWYLKHLEPKAKVATVGLFSPKEVQENSELFKLYDYIVVLEHEKDKTDPCDKVHP